MKKIKDFLIKVDWVICQTIGVLFLTQDLTIPGCALVITGIYLSEKDRILDRRCKNK